jgi:heme-degrading monooxygenase HmoA
VICVQFILQPGTYDDDFRRLDGEIDAFARSLPGFHATETWRSADGTIVNATYYFDDMASVRQLSQFPQHLEAKGQYERWYEGYRIIVSEVTASYGDDRLSRVTGSPA